MRTLHRAMVKTTPSIQLLMDFNEGPTREADLEMVCQQPRSTVLHNQWTGRQSQSPSMSLLELLGQVPQSEGQGKDI